MSTSPISSGASFNFSPSFQSENLQLIMKIVVGCFALLMGVRVIYSLLSRVGYFTKGESSEASTSTTLIPVATQGFQYSAAGQEALAFARAELGKHPNLKPAWQNLPENRRPVNPEIALLQTLYVEHRKRLEGLHQKALDTCLPGPSVHPWLGKPVEVATDACMKIAFAISMLTLDDLTTKIDQQALSIENFNKQATYKTRSLALTLTSTENYAYRASFILPEIYHLVRFETEWASLDEGVSGFKAIGEKLPSRDYALHFYQEGNFRSKWRDLYNEYCDRLLHAIEWNMKETAILADWMEEDVKDDTSINSFEAPDFPLPEFCPMFADVPAPQVDRQ